MPDLKLQRPVVHYVLLSARSAQLQAHALKSTVITAKSLQGQARSTDTGISSKGQACCHREPYHHKNRHVRDMHIARETDISPYGQACFHRDWSP